MSQQRLVSKSNKNDKIKLSTIFIIGIVLVALVLSIVSMILATKNNFDNFKGTLDSTYTRNDDFNRMCKNWVENTDLKDFQNVNSITFDNNSSIKTNTNDGNAVLEVNVENESGAGLINFVGSTGKTTLALNDVNRDIIQIINASGNDNNGKYWYYNYRGEDGKYSPPDN